MDKIIFGTDGWRALQDSSINTESIARVAVAFSKFLKLKVPGKKTHKVVIGFDGRRNSKLFANTYADVLSIDGINVVLSHELCSTPCVSYNTSFLHADAGVMITASHNPATYNGIKFKSSNGSPFSTEDTKVVEHLIEDSLPKGDIYKSNIEVLNLKENYIKRLKEIADINKIKNSGLKVAFDAMGGAAENLLEEILGSEIVTKTMHSPADQNFYGLSAEPIEKNLSLLSSELKKDYYSLGLASDGDGDRVGVMTDKGEWMNIQETIIYLSEYLLKKSKEKNQSLVKTLSVSSKIFSLAEKYNSKVHDVQVGFKYVSEAMQENSSLFGAEESGGFGFKSFVPERDGVLSSLMLLEMLADSKFKTLSEFISSKRQEHGVLYYERIDSPYHKENREELLGTLFNSDIVKIGPFNIENKISHNSSRGIINSVKYYLEGNRWLLLRSSETEPMLRIYAEGNSVEEPQKLLELGMKLIENIG